MIVKTSTPLFKQVVDITYDYLGPASQRFIAREIKTHLRKKPEQLTADDIPVLLDWSKLAIALLTDDKELVDDFSHRLLALAKRPGR